MLKFTRHILTALAAAALTCASPAAAEPALWAIKDADSTIYLFGTVHYLRPGTEWNTPKINRALAASGELILELPGEPDAAVINVLIRNLGFDPAKRLSARMPQKDRPRLAAAAKALGLQPQALEGMRPWFAAMTLSILPATKAGYDADSGVEQVLTGQAKALGAPIRGFETYEQQFRFLADLPDDVQVDLLSATLDDIDDAVRQLDVIVGAWAAGDTAALEREFVGEMRRDYPETYEVIIAARNRAWADALKTRLAGSGVSFVAVGAGHLVGPDSVQVELKKRGVEVERQ